MLTIRLQRTGKKNQSDFRIVLAEKAKAVQKKVQEILGSYNPRKKYFKINEERLKYWLSERVETSPTLHNLLVTNGLISEAKVKAFSTPKKAEEKSAEISAEKPTEPVAETALAESQPVPTASSESALAEPVAETLVEPKVE
jgi:small subunit ribosomal protein S16